MNAPEALDNPIWSSLATRHRGIARMAGEAARYPQEFAPFFAVAAATAEAGAALASLLAVGERALLIGVAPPLADAWRVDAVEHVAQMTCRTPAAVVDGPVITRLDGTRLTDVLALTALVYPHYFRRRTLELGRYFGIYQDGRLAALAGERMGTDTQVELSGICTHPEFMRRGYAHRLVAFLTNDLLAHGRTPFLHVSLDNPHAKTLYADLGYRVRCELPFWSLRRL